MTVAVTQLLEDETIGEAKEETDKSREDDPPLVMTPRLMC